MNLNNLNTEPDYSLKESEQGVEFENHILHRIFQGEFDETHDIFFVTDLKVKPPYCGSKTWNKYHINKNVREVLKNQYTLDIEYEKKIKKENIELQIKSLQEELNKLTNEQ